MDLIFKLKEFYLLEMFQLTLYESQVESLQNEYILHAYQRIIELERHHVDFYKERLRKQGEDLPLISGGLFALAGHFFGNTLDLTSAENRYKIGVALEAKAIEMYRVFLMETWEEYPDICKRLWHNMIDEEFHLLWFKDNLKHTTSLVKST
jgi:demethoxyubiquinone hydroxylase (CLK1/Coq7/Cat5 family)